MQTEPSADLRRRFGAAVGARAEEVAQAVVTAWAAGPAATPRDQNRVAGIMAPCVLATELVGRWLAGGRGASNDEKGRLADSGRTTADGGFGLVDLTKNYLAWRDATVSVVQEEAARLAVGAEQTANAIAMVRHSCDTSLVHVVRQFDDQRQQLERRLDQERAKLAHLALHDALTGLANRALLLDRLRHAVARAARDPHRTAVLFIDLDRFKEVNDTLGHEAGDRLLIAVAERLSGLVRTEDTVARLGGDEFVVLCDGLDDAPPPPTVVVDRVTRALAQPFWAGEQLYVRGSIGLAIAGAGSDPEAVLAAADAAMYVAKQRSREAYSRPVPATPDAAAASA